ncbi:hypothetical protein E4U30_007843 [Claviceps sp. LM220 group G6]|nr:hypothetical protein E4U30_007843 [Claviceps sp. LM220 group G6]
MYVHGLLRGKRNDYGDIVNARAVPPHDMYVHGLLRGLSQGLLLRRLKDIDRLPGEAEEAPGTIPHHIN